MQTNAPRPTSPPLPHNIDEPVEPITGLPGAIVLFSDIACPWATVAVLRLRAAREQLAGRQSSDHPPGAPARADLQPAVDASGHRGGDAGLCRRRPGTRVVALAGTSDEYPVSSLLALEAVQAARRQSEAAAEELDLALRTALFAKSRCITLRHEILAAARSTRSSTQINWLWIWTPASRARL